MKKKKYYNVHFDKEHMDSEQLKIEPMVIFNKTFIDFISPVHRV